MEKDFKYYLGLNVKAERTRINVTQEQFAEMIEMSASYVSKLEQGLISPSGITLYKMSKVLNIQMEDFFKRIEL